MSMFSLPRTAQPQSHVPLGGTGAFPTPAIALNFGAGARPPNVGSRGGSWAASSWGQVEAGRGGMGYTQRSDGTNPSLKFGTSSTVAELNAANSAGWMMLVFRVAAYGSFGSSVNLIAHYGTMKEDFTGAWYAASTNTHFHTFYMPDKLVNIQTATLGVGNVRCAVWGRDADGNGWLWIDGRLIGSVTGANAAVTGTASPLGIGALNFNRRYQGNVLAVAAGPESPLSFGAALSANPWQLFAPVERSIFTGLEAPRPANSSRRPLQLASPQRTLQPQNTPELAPGWGTGFAYIPSGATFYDAATRRLGNIRPEGANGQPSVFKGGRSLLFTQQNTHSQWLPQPNFRPGLGDFWVLVQGTFVSEAIPVVALSNYASGAAAASNQWRLQPNYNGSATVAGSFSFLTYDGAFVNCGANGLFADGELCTFLGVRRGNLIELWKNGALVASTVSPQRNVSGSAQQDVGFTVLEGSLYTAGGHRSIGAGGLGSLTPSQARTLSQNPWQLFTAGSREAFPDLGGAPPVAGQRRAPAIITKGLSSQPQSAPIVDTSISLTSGLVGFITPTLRPDRWTRTGAVAFGASPGGIALLGTTSSLISAPIDGAMGKQATLLYVGNMPWGSVASGVAASFGNSGNGTHGFWIQGASGSTPPRAVMRPTDASGITTAEVAGGTNSTSYPAVEVWVAVYRSTTDLRIFRNGVNVTSGMANVAAPDVSLDFQNVGLNGVRRGTNTAYGGAYRGLLTLGYNRALTDAEVRDLSRNPWQVFKALSSETFLDYEMLPSGLLVPMLFNPTVSNIQTTSVDPSVSLDF